MKTIIEVIIILTIIIIIFYNFLKDKQNAEEFIFSSSNELILNTTNSTTYTNQADISTSTEKIKIYIIGQVKSNGVIELDYGSRIEDAIILAGGTTDIADLSKVNLAYLLEDGQKIYIPSIYDIDTSTQYVSFDNGENIIENSDLTSSNSNKKININKATISDLTSISGIGEATAQKIIDYRTKNGNFKSIEDLKEITGIGEKKFEKIKDYIDIK